MVPWSIWDKSHLEDGDGRPRLAQTVLRKSYHWVTVQQQQSLFFKTPGAHLKFYPSGPEEGKGPVL